MRLPVHQAFSGVELTADFPLASALLSFCFYFSQFVRISFYIFNNVVMLKYCILNLSEAMEQLKEAFKDSPFSFKKFKLQVSSLQHSPIWSGIIRSLLQLMLAKCGLGSDLCDSVIFDFKTPLYLCHCQIMFKHFK